MEHTARQMADTQLPDPSGMPGYSIAEDEQDAADRMADALDQWADGYVEPEVQTGADEIEYADEREYI